MPEPIVTPEVTPAAPVVVTPAAPVAPAEPSFTYKEDRSKWVDPGKLTAAERATNLAAQRNTQLEAAIAERDRKIAALAGVSPKDPDEEVVNQTKAAFAKMYPSLAKMAELDPEKLERILATGDQAQHVVQQHWDTHRDQTLGELKGRVAQAMGLSELTKTQAAKVVAAFKASVPDQRDDPEGYARWSQRYESRDTTLLDEFTNEFVGDFITPAQRSGMVRPRMNVPSGGFSRPVATNQNKQPEYGKMKTVQEMLEAAEAQADAHYGT